MTDFTNEDLLNVERYLNGEVPLREVRQSAGHLFSLADVVRKRMFEQVLGADMRVKTIEAKLSRFQKRSDEEERNLVENDEFHQLNLTPLDLAKAVQYQAQLCKTTFSESYLMLIVYSAYCTWLHRNKERITSEHPVAWQYGPAFRSIHYGLEKDTRLPEDGWRTVCRESPGVASMIDNLVSKRFQFMQYRSAAEFFTQKDSPWWQFSKGKGRQEKWGADISDSAIFWWKRAEKENRQ